MFLFALNPRLAAIIASLIVCEPQLADRLVEVCERESNCTAVGVHRIDQRHSRAAWRSAVRAGWVDPSCQAEHDGWATRGSWGTMAAFTVHHLGPCMPAWTIDIPLLGAIAAARRMKHPMCNRYAACRRWRDGKHRRNGRAASADRERRTEAK